MQWWLARYRLMTIGSLKWSESELLEKFWKWSTVKVFKSVIYGRSYGDWSLTWSHRHRMAFCYYPVWYIVYPVKYAHSFGVSCCVCVVVVVGVVVLWWWVWVWVGVGAIDNESKNIGLNIGTENSNTVFLFSLSNRPCVDVAKLKIEIIGLNSIACHKLCERWNKKRYVSTFKILLSCTYLNRMRGDKFYKYFDD